MTGRDGGGRQTEPGGPVSPWPGAPDAPQGPRTPPTAWGRADESWAPAPPAPRPARRSPRLLLFTLVAVLLVALGGGAALAWPSLSGLLPWAGAPGGGAGQAVGSFRNGATQAWTFDLTQQYPGQKASFPFGPNLDDASSNVRFGPVAAGDVWLVPVSLPNGGELVGLDAATGVRRWSVPGHLETCRPGPKAGTAFCVTVPDEAGQATLLLIDLATGAVQEKRQLSGWSYLDVTGDTVVVASDPGSGTAGVVVDGFDAQGAPRWHTALPDTRGGLVDIRIPLRAVDGLVHVIAGGDSLILDAATGEVLLRGASLDVAPGRRVLVRPSTQASGAGTGLTRLTGYSATDADERGRWGLFRDATGGPQWCEGAKPDACRDLGLGAGAIVDQELVSSADAAYAQVYSDAWRRIALVDVSTGAVQRLPRVDGASRVVAPGPAVADRADDGTLSLLDAASGATLGSARLRGWHLVTGDTGRLALAYTGSDRADGYTSTALTVFVPAATPGSGLTLAGATASAVPTGQGNGAGLPDCPAGTTRLASAVFDDGDWVLVCGIDAATPTAWRSRLAGQEVSSDRVSVQPSADGSGGPGGYTAALPDGSAWLSSAPAMAGRSDGSGHLSYSRAASGQIWFVWLGGATPQPSQGSYGVPVPAASAADQVRYLSQLLDQSAATRSSLEASVSSIRECRRGADGDYRPDLAGIDAAATNRQQLLTALQTAPVDQIPQGTALVNQLHEAIALSLQVDQWYAAWARTSTASGCAPLGEDGGRSLSDRTGKAKDAFVAAWNSRIAPAYGVAQTARAKI